MVLLPARPHHQTLDHLAGEHEPEGELRLLALSHRTRQLVGDNLGDLLRTYERVIVPEMNTGQLKTLLRDQFLVDAQPLNKTSGQPFKIAEIEAAIEEALA